MRVIWETEGKHLPSPEYEAFLNISRLHDLTTEEIDRRLVEEAETESRKYHIKLKEQISERQRTSAPEHRSELPNRATAATDDGP